MSTELETWLFESEDTPACLCLSTGQPRSQGDDDPGELEPLVQRPAVDVDAQLARNDGPGVSHSEWRASSGDYGTQETAPMGW